MDSKDNNLLQLETIASALGDLLPQVTFVGGSTTALLVDEAALFGVRETNDVDVIISVATYLEYQKFSEKLRARGFKEDIKKYLAEQASLLLNDSFLNVLPGMLNNSNSASAVEGYLKIMSKW